MKNPIQIIHECSRNNEPTFTFRAKDRASIIALETYLLVIEDRNSNPEFKQEVRDIVNSFHLWQIQNQHLTRMPD